MAASGRSSARFVEKLKSCYLIFATWHGNKKNNKNKKPNIYGLLDAMQKKFVMQIKLAGWSKVSPLWTNLPTKNQL